MSVENPSSQDDSLLVCPVCSGRLSIGSKQAACPAGHSFDRAREGYFNLLLANQKGSNDPGDDRESVNARREFLTAGNYEFLIDAIRPRIASDATVLDAGCGEGYFLSALAGNLGYGVDISRPGIRIASRTHRTHTWAVANVARTIPIADDSCDVILSIMAPRNASEFHRILRATGSLICVIPGPNHLRQLTDLLMDHDPNQSSKPRTLVDSLSPEFILSNEHRVAHEIDADQPTISNLVTMTPLRWKSRKESLAKVASLDHLTITADFRILKLTPEREKRERESG